MKEYYERNASQPLFEIGQSVWVYTPKAKKDLSKKLLYNWFGPYRIVEQSFPVHYRLRSKNNKKVTFAVHANRMKPFVDPTLRPIEPPIDDDPSEPYLDEADIILLTLSKLASLAVMITIRMSLLRSTMHVRQHIHKKLSRAQINKIRSLLIINQFLLLREFSRHVKEKAKCNIRSNGSAILEINQSGNRRKIFWINVLSNILSMAKSEISENLVCSIFES